MFLIQQNTAKTKSYQILIYEFVKNRFHCQHKELLILTVQVLIYLNSLIHHCQRKYSHLLSYTFLPNQKELKLCWLLHLTISFCKLWKAARTGKGHSALVLAHLCWTQLHNLLGVYLGKMTSDFIFEVGIIMPALQNFSKKTNKNFWKDKELFWPCKTLFKYKSSLIQSYSTRKTGTNNEILRSVEEVVRDCPGLN